MTIDERLEFLLKSTESLHSTMQEMISNQEQRWEKADAQMGELRGVMAAIASTVLNHEQRLNKGNL